MSPLPSSWQRRIVGLAVRCYGCFLYGYPPALRRHYGLEMKQLFLDCNHNAWRQQGWAGLFWVWRHTLFDLLKTIPKEQYTVLLSWWMQQEKGIFKQILRSKPMADMQIDTPPFVAQLAAVLAQEPRYFPLLVGDKPTQRIQELIESLALEGDPQTPQKTLALFQALGQDLPEAHLDRWLNRLGQVFRDIFSSPAFTPDSQATAILLRLIYTNPQYYELVAASEPGYGLLDIVESLALEAEVDEVADMLALMQTLSEQGYHSPA